MKLTFACGAELPEAKESPVFSHRRANGDGRLCVYDSDSDLMTPKLAGKDAPCLWGCPAKRASGRKQVKCFPSDEVSMARKSAAGGRMGVDIPWRHVVTCYCRTEES